MPKNVFPMYVGVILKWHYYARWPMGIPHVCGGDPEVGQRLNFLQQENMQLSSNGLALLNGVRTWLTKIITKSKF